MKKLFYKTISILLFPMYVGAFFISHLFKIPGYENMETFEEWWEIATIYDEMHS